MARQCRVSSFARWSVNPLAHCARMRVKIRSLIFTMWTGSADMTGINGSAGTRAQPAQPIYPPPTSSINFTVSPSLSTRCEYSFLGRNPSSLTITWIARSSRPSGSSKILPACPPCRLTIRATRSANVPWLISNCDFLPINFDKVGNPSDSIWIFNAHLHHRCSFR